MIKLVSSCPKYTNMKILKSKMHERSFLVSNISAEIFTNNNIPSLSKFLIELSFNNTSNFTIFLSFKDIGHIGNFLDSSIGNTDNSTLIFRTKIRHFNKNLFIILSRLIFLILLLLINLLILLIMFGIKPLVLKFISHIIVLELWHCSLFNWLARLIY